MTDNKTKNIGWKFASSAGVVAAGSPEAVAAGIGILENGGNAADAAVATIFSLCITDHGDCSIGGEVPLLIYDADSGKVDALCGQGRAPLSPEATDWYMANGIPGNGDIKMAPVPSVVDLCITTLQRYGSRSLAEISAPAMALLDAGDESWHPRLAVTLHKMVEEEQQTSGTREEKLQAASDRFYGRNRFKSDIADDLETYYIEQGGFLRKSDLAKHITTVETPTTVEFAGYTICKCGPWTQGPFLCQALRLLEGFDLKAMGRRSADYIHVVTEAVKLAMADRDEYYGDPDFTDVPLSALLSDKYTKERRKLIDMHYASMCARPGDPYVMQPLKPEAGVFRPGTASTTTCVVADRWGNVVSATPSANVPKQPRDGGLTGVTFGNRLRSLNTTLGHPNCIEPGKRPRITLTPTLVLRDGSPVMAVSVAGGDLQDQVTLNLLLYVIEFGMSPEEAVTAPRFATYHHQDSFDPNPDRTEAFIEPGSLTLNADIDSGERKKLSARGHRLKVETAPIGRPVMLCIDVNTGIMHAAGDPAAGRHVSGLEE